jgi:hypothetical protein
LFTTGKLDLIAVASNLEPLKQPTDDSLTSSAGEKVIKQPDMTDPDKSQKRLIECPECGEPADVKVVGYEFGIDISPGTDLRICSESPQDHNDGLGGAVYFHFGDNSQSERT